MVVTGASSFIGANFVEKLLSCHDEVIAVLRPDSKNRRLFKERFEEKVRIVSMDMSEYGHCIILSQPAIILYILLGMVHEEKLALIPVCRKKITWLRWRRFRAHFG